ncbi:type II secretion system minor pseudopilin [Bdellovibrio svalbardensis]|uniref:General secretion pathway protein GspK n=1 Tax=Bdellovibrio svalbardensis TaxID=2972972 RepID=A0ABT6DND0_9BACT|nr:type II secretion system protein GspK [Bdellovibrio svalbardensis]MDG0817444.1 general secretion pathway protein GspK [Bdellovibrio svalbardensis]
MVKALVKVCRLRLASPLNKPLNNNRGIALMVAIACVMMIMYFAMEVSYDANVEYLVNSQGLNRVKAYYAAKSGMQLSLLRIKIYQQAQDKFGAQLGANNAMLDQIWQFPFAWPLPIPDEMSVVDKDSFKKLVKDSSMDASYIVTIEDEGSKIDINDLNSPSKTLQEITKTQLLNIFEQKKKSDEEFARKYSNVRFEELINTIADWGSSKSQSLNGGDKRSRFSELNQESQSDSYPPNRAFRSLAEMHMVPGMTDEFYDLLASRVTIYGMKGINPNIASKEVLKSLDPGMTDEAVSAIIKRRNDANEGGPFKNAEDFWAFVQQKGVRTEGKTDLVPLIFESVFNFKIRSTGEFAGATREITAIVMDFNKTAAKIKTYTDKDKKDAGGAPPPGSGGGTGAKSGTKIPLAKGPPRIVYWNER